jgi:hypothetical protein
MINYTIDEIIKMLEAEKEMGTEKILFEGTIMTPENGNKIILTTEKQM